MQIGQVLIPRKLDLDSSPLNIQSDTAYFMKGIDIDWVNSGDGVASAGELKPMQSNQLYCSVALPEGENQVIGFYFFEEATEGYVVVYNSNKNHLIYRLEGRTGQCRIVYRFCSPSTNIPMTPIIDVILGGNLNVGLNTGKITGTPGSKIEIRIATTVGTTSGNIDGGIVVSGGEGVAYHEVILPPSGVLNYDIILGNSNPIPQLSVHAFHATGGPNTITIPADFLGGPTQSQLLDFFTIGTKIDFGGSIGILTITDRSLYSTPIGIVLTFSQTVPAFSNGVFIATKVPVSIMTATAIVVGDEFAANITNNPKDFFSEGRISIKSLCKFFPDGSKELYKELVLVNKKIPNARIVVEDSIATDSFTTPFFTPKNSCCGDCNRIIKVGVPTPMADIKVVPILATPADEKVQNELLFKMFKFRFKDINGWGQVSEHGKISDPFFNNLSACSKDASGSPHCVWLETKTPCPEIVRRIIEVQSCALKGDSGATDGAVLSEWKEYATIDLYDQSDPNLKWYEREYKTNNKEFEFFNDGKDIRFKFCNNRECKTIPLDDIRDENPAPFTSGTVASLGKGFIYGDNDTDFDKLSEADKKGISFELVPAPAECEVKYSRIKVYAVIHNRPSEKKNQVIWQFNGVTGFGGYIGGAATLAIFVPAATSLSNNSSGWGQFFPDGVDGFRGVLAGTGYMAESKQKLWTPTDLIDIGVLGKSEPINIFVESLMFGHSVVVQEFDFGLVPHGKYVFRICGHADTEDIERTSTYYLCTTSWNGYKANGVPILGDYIKEIYIDTTSGNDYDSLVDDKVAVIADLSSPDGSRLTSLSGYLYEDKFNRQPIELAEIAVSHPTVVSSMFTDHNGFYFGRSVWATNFYIDIYGYNRCTPNLLLAKTLVTNWSGGIGPKHRIEKPSFATDRFPNYVTDLCNRYIVSGTIKECGLTTGVAGVSIILGRTKPVYSNAAGEFRVVAHFNRSRGSDLLIFSIGTNCNILDCNCKSIKVAVTVIQPICGMPGCLQSIINIGNFNVKTIVWRGFEHGSRVPIGIQAHDWLGRHTDVQDMEDWTVEIPSEQDQGNSNYPRIKVNLPPVFSQRFIKEFKYLTFFFGKNIGYDDFIEWAADKIEFIDTAGKVNTASPSKIRVWYRSLNEFNSLRGFNTNTNWKVQSTAGNSMIGDIVEFIQNADGKYLAPGLFGNVQYAKDGSYFVVDYDQSLSVLKDGVKFKLKRPAACETTRPYYEYGFTINFCGKDGVPRDDNGNVITEFFLDGFTTYMQPRLIPVVTDVIDVIVNPDFSTTEKVAQKKQVKVYPFNFEHHSPSDTWGDHCFSGGRIGYKNPYEGRKCNRNQLLVTGVINSANDGVINYLHYFSLADEFLIDEQGWGGIMAIIVRNDGQIMLICETTTFSLAYNDDRARVTADGYIKLPLNGRFSRPEKDDAWAFGCQAKDLNTIRRNGPLVMYMDSQKCALVIHNFSTAIDVSAGAKSWLTEGIKLSNGNDDIYFHANFDNRGDKKYVLTRFNKKLNQYVNDAPEQNNKMNETLAFNLATKTWEQFLHTTPEYFGNMYGEAKDTQFFSFKNGLAYSHHNAITTDTKYLNYFGIQCNPYIGVVTNMESAKVKSYLYSEVYCFDQLFIIEKILTEMGQESSVFEGMWDWSEGFWKAPFLCDTKFVDQSDPSQGAAVIDGDTLYGRWMKALYMAYNKNGTPYDGRFFKLTAIISFIFGRDKSGK